MKVKSDLGLMREMNRGLILSIIQRGGPLSRADLAKQTTLNPSTITRIVAELVQEGFVKEIGLAHSHGGRKPVLLDLAPNAVNIIGINIEASSVMAIIADLKGGICARLDRPILSTTKEDIINLATEVIAELLKEAGNLGISIFGIGVAMHGLVDSDRGIALFPPAFKWKNLPLAEILEDHFELPVYLENNARAMTLGERWFGNGKGISDFICIKVGQGIGSGIILQDSLLRGIDHTVGEIGHTTVTLDGPLCNCGNYGCLETLASTNALVGKARKYLKEGVTSSIMDLAGGDLEKITIYHVYQAATEDDGLALRLLAEIGRYLGIAIANVVNLLNPVKVLIGGDILGGLPFVLPALREIVKARAMEIPANRVLIEPVKLREHAAAIGAVTLVLEDIFHRS